MSLDTNKQSDVFVLARVLLFYQFQHETNEWTKKWKFEVKVWQNSKYI